MAVIATYTQQPSERLDYDLPFDLAEDDALDPSSVSAVTSPSGLMVNPMVVGHRVKLWVEGGTSMTTYKTEVTVSTTLGRTKQVEVRFKIKEQ